MFLYCLVHCQPFESEQIFFWLLLGELKDAASRDVSHFSRCAACSSSSSCSRRKGSSERQVVVGASENPALQSGAGEFPVVTTKPTIIRMLVCHRGVSLLGCFLPPCESRIIYFGSLRFSFPLSGKRLPPFPPSPSFLSPPSQHLSQWAGFM